MNELATLRKIEQSKLAIREVKTLAEIKKVIDQGEALKAYARSAQMSAEIQADIAELNLVAERRLGEISAKMEKAPANQYKKSALSGGGQGKTETLANEGISRQRANEAEILKDIDEGVFSDLLQASREIGIPKADFLKVAKMEPEQQKAVAEKIASGEAKSVTDARRKVLKDTIVSQYTAPKKSPGITDIHTTKEKFRVIYADPPWAYNDARSGKGTTGATDHYPTMPLKEICALPVKKIAEDNAVLFLWVTSPLLEVCFEVIKAWGFKYKASFVWDKVKHNMGHYNSVRHEFLLVCTRGSCTPDKAKLFNSVQRKERKEHSRKPEEFREMIEIIYPAGKRIELFAKTKTSGWNSWGYEA